MKPINKISASQIMLVARSWSERGDNTDFRHFFRYFPGSVNITHTVNSKFDNIFFRKLKVLANHGGYSSLSVYLEWQAFKKSIYYWPKIIHYWFADHDYHFSGYTSKAVGAKLIGNFFFSIDEFENRMPDKSHLNRLDLIHKSCKSCKFMNQYYINIT